MMKLWLTVLVLGVLVVVSRSDLVGSITANGNSPLDNYVAILNGMQEVPEVDTQGRGQASFQAVGPFIQFRLQAANLSSSVTAAHIHCAAEGGNGPVGVTLYSNNSNGHPGGNGLQVSGVITGPDPGNRCGWGNGKTNADLLAALSSGNTYVNVHTLNHPGGEIRGQIIPLPPKGY